VLLVFFVFKDIIWYISIEIFNAENVTTSPNPLLCKEGAVACTSCKFVVNLLK
jgi:hypothetical protein